MASDIDLTSELMAARPGEDLLAVFQPQIDVATGLIVAAEVLCRWRHPHIGFVPPDEFIPLSEETGTIELIGELVLNEGLDLIDTWHRQGVVIEAAVNVSPLQLTTPAFVDRLREKLDVRTVPSRALTIEITESRPIDQPSVVHELERLRALGVGVSLDDFGTGHASTTQLKRLPISEVKLDKTLIQSVLPGAEDQLNRTMKIARERSLRVLAEGIETGSHLRRAMEIGCDRVQGYLLGRPVRRASFDALLG